MIPDDPFKKGQDLRGVPHVVLALLGKVKGENETCYHMIILPNERISGIKLQWWIEKLIEIQETEGFIAEPAFGQANGKLAVSCDYDKIFKAILKHVQQEEIGLIPVEEDVDKHYGISCTMKKTAVSRFKSMGLNPDIVYGMNRWKTVENAKEKILV